MNIWLMENMSEDTFNRESFGVFVHQSITTFEESKDGTSNPKQSANSHLP